MRTPRDAPDLVGAAVRAVADRLGPGLFGVACSGGADSIALAHATIRAVGAAHTVILVIDHALVPGSAEVGRAVAAWAHGQGAAAIVERVVVGRRASIEAAARDARYAALEQLADRLGLVAVLTGHTARDQAETVLMRVLRGTGPAGLAGIPARRGRFARPLLALPRAAIDAYITAHALPTWADPMNEDRTLARVRMRHELLPLLRRENPQLDAALGRLAASAGEWLEVIDRHAAPFATFPIDCAALSREPAAIRKRAVSLALERAGLDYDASHLDELDRVISRPARGQVAIDLPGGRLERSYGVLAPAVAPPPAPPLRVPPGPFVLRIWQPGDRIRLARLQGRSRKLSDLYIDHKVPRAARAQARVLVRITDEVIVWAEHLGLAHGEPPELAPTPARTGGPFHQI